MVRGDKTIMNLENNMIGKRDETVDILKGIAIFCVVLGHINPIVSVYNFIYSFHMALFMFLSGVAFWFSFEKKRMAEEMGRKAICEYILKRFASLIIPFLAWCGIKGVVLDKERNFLINVRHNFNSYWFLPTLFGILLFTTLPKLFRKAASQKQEFLFDVLIFFLSGILSAILFKYTQVKLFRQILIYLPPFCLGLFLQKYAVIKRLVLSHFTIGFSIIAYSAILPFYSVADTSAVSLVARFMTGLLFTVIIFNFCSSNLSKINGNIKNYITTIGRSSLQIYLLQEFFRNTVPIQINGGGQWQDSFLRMAIAVCICLIGVAVHRICDMTVWLNFALFGVVKRK